MRLNRKQWFAAVLAAITTALVVRVNLVGLPTVPMAQLPARDLVLLGGGSLSAATLWVWMVRHYWTYPGRHMRTVLVLLLLLGLHIGAVIYCVAIYLRPGASTPPSR